MVPVAEIAPQRIQTPGWGCGSNMVDLQWNSTVSALVPVGCLRDVGEDAPTVALRDIASAHAFSLEARGGFPKGVHYAPGDIVAAVRARRLGACDLEQRRGALDDDAPEVLARAVRDVDLERCEIADLTDQARRLVLAQSPLRAPLLSIFFVAPHLTRQSYHALTRDGDPTRLRADRPTRSVTMPAKRSKPRLKSIDSTPMGLRPHPTQRPGSWSGGQGARGGTRSRYDGGAAASCRPPAARRSP